mgnify:CR=1 FL=1
MSYEDNSLPGLDIGNINILNKEQLIETIQLAVKKLKYQGKLRIEFINLEMFCKEYLWGSRTTDIVLNLKNTIDITSIKDTLEKLKVKISKIEIIDCKYVVEGIKQ